MGKSMQSMVSIDGISKAFGGLRAVDNCRFDIPKGGITGLIGPNGAGKTTLFSIIAGAIRPDSGTVTLDGENITGLPTHRLFHKGLVRTFQIPHEFSRMSVRDNLMVVPADQSGENVGMALFAWSRVAKEERAIRQKVDEVLGFLQIDHLADELAGNLSGGEKKLLELGRTMMTDARMVFLDEIGAGVTRSMLGKLADTILRLNKERGYTFCIIEHDMDLISKLCNPVVVMAHGSVLAMGTMEEIRANAEVREAYLGGGTVAGGKQ